MSADETRQPRRRPRRIVRASLPSGPAQDLRDAIYTLYLEADTPTLDDLVSQIEQSDDLPGAPKRDTISSIISGRNPAASQQDTVTVAVALLRRRGRATGRDPAAFAERIRDLWVAATASGRPAQDDQHTGIWMVPDLGRTPVRRDQPTGRLLELLQSGAKEVGLWGPGGFGKTTLAVQVCWEARDHFPGGVLWLTLGEHVPDEVLADKINDLSEVIAGIRPTVTDPAIAGYRLGELLSGRKRTLLVVDDLWSASRLTALPTMPGLVRIVTTRTRAALPVECAVVPIREMTPEEGNTVLTAGLSDFAAQQRLMSLTGGWPLLLALVNGAIRRETDSGATLDEAAGAVEEQLMFDGPDSLDLESADRRDQAVRATVEAGLRRLGTDGREKALLLGVFPEDVEIPIEIVQLIWSPDRPSDIRRRIRHLADLSLITPRGGAIQIHDVLRAYLRSALGRGFLTEAHRVLTDSLRAHDEAGWRSLHPYARRHLPEHATDAGLLDSLIQDAGFLLAVEQPGLLARLNTVHGADASAAARAYRRSAHHLRDQAEDDRAAYLGFAARREGHTALADGAEQYADKASWWCLWTSWNREPEHTMLARHPDAVDQVELATLADGRTWSMSKAIDGSVRIVDLESNENVIPPWAPDREAIVVACVPLPDGRCLAVHGNWVDTQVWDLLSGQPVTWDEMEAHPCQEVSWTQHSGRPVVVTGDSEHRWLSRRRQRIDVVLRAWDPTTGGRYGKTIRFATEARFWTIATGQLPDGRMVVAAAAEWDPIRVWDVETGLPVGVPVGGGELRTMGLAWGRRGLYCSGDWPEVIGWNVLTGQKLESLGGDMPRSYNLRCTESGSGDELLLAGAGDGRFHIWSTGSGTQVIEPLKAHTDSVRGIAYAELRDGRKVVVTGGNENTVRLWDLEQLAAVKPAAARLGPVSQVVHFDNGFVTRHRDGGTQVWTANGTAGPRPGPSAVNSLAALHRDGKPTGMLLVGRESGFVLWNPSSGEYRNELGVRRRWPIGSGWLFADGRAVAVIAGRGRTIEGWDLGTGTRLWRSQASVRRRWRARSDRWPSRVTAIAITLLPDGRPAVVSGAMEGTIQLWDLNTGAPIGVPMHDWGEYQPSPAFITELVCVRRGEEVVAINGSESSRVTAWELGTQRRLGIFRGGGSARVDSVMWVIPTGGTPVVLSGDTILRAWSPERTTPEGTWAPILEIDLDAPINTLDADGPETVVVGTDHGVARLRLRRLHGQPPPGEAF
jgi:WD40 repeat protein